MEIGCFSIGKVSAKLKFDKLKICFWKLLRELKAQEKKSMSQEVVDRTYT